MSSRGFTLIEVVVATVLLQVGLLGVLGTLARATELRTEAERLEDAIDAAESVRDSLASLDSIGSGGGGRVDRGGVVTEWARSGQELRVVAYGPGERTITVWGWTDRP